MVREELTGYDHFKVAKVGDIVVAAFVYEKILDEHLSRKINEELLLLAELTSRGFVLNFAGVSFVNSVMLEGLVQLETITKDRNVRLRLCCIGPNVMGVFNITRLNLLFKIYTTEENALRSF